MAVYPMPKINQTVTPLFHATRDDDDINIIRILIQRGADVSIANNDGVTPQHNTADFGSSTIFQYLLDRGANPATASAHGKVSTHWAASSYNTDILMLLGDLRADLDQPTNSGSTPLLCAIHSGCGTEERTRTLEYLLNKGADIKLIRLMVGLLYTLLLHPRSQPRRTSFGSLSSIVLG
jgi:ankyrin repeat protein